MQSQIIRNAKNAVEFFDSQDLDYHFENEWDNPDEVADFKKELETAFNALKALINAYEETTGERNFNPNLQEPLHSFLIRVIPKVFEEDDKTFSLLPSEEDLENMIKNTLNLLKHAYEAGNSGYYQFTVELAHTEY